MPLVFDIQRFCVNDGPGIRSTVFLKGCPLSCPWCHNPESNSFVPQLSYDGSRCIGCGTCVAACPNGVHELGPDGVHLVSFPSCAACGLCVTACPAGALSIYGRKMGVERIVAELAKDEDYYQTSGGGVTISGGEPMSRFQDTLAIARAVKERGWHLCLETSGYGRRDQFRELAGLVDLFLLDYKVTGNDRYLGLIGMEEGHVLGTLATLDQLGAPVILRCPIVPGHSDDAAHLEAIARLSETPCVDHVEVLPYHDFGVGKARRIGSGQFLAGVTMPSDDWAEGVIAAIVQAGARDVRRG